MHLVSHSSHTSARTHSDCRRTITRSTRHSNNELPKMAAAAAAAAAAVGAVHVLRQCAPTPVCTIRPPWQALPLKDTDFGTTPHTSARGIPALRRPSKTPPHTTLHRGSGGATLQGPQARARATHRGITGGHTLTQDGRDRLTGQPQNSLRHFLRTLGKSGISVESSPRSMLGKSQVSQEGLCFPYEPFGIP